MLEEVYRRDFDIVHFHVDYLHFAVTRRSGIAAVTTLHGRLDLPDLQPLYREFPEMCVVSISNAQRTPLPNLRWQGTVLHGLPRDLHALGPGGDYLAFVGRISPEKRVDRAIDIATRAGMRLVIAAKVDNADKAYFAEYIEPLLSQPGVEYVGELDERAKGELLANATALVFPIDWPEPFGLVMIEAMACGTPTIAWRCGSVPEVIDEGVTGYIVDDLDGAVAAIERVRQGALPRAQVRAVFERRFTSSRMADDYLALYHRIVGEVADGSHSRVAGLRHPGDRVARG